VYQLFPKGKSLISHGAKEYVMHQMKLGKQSKFHRQENNGIPKLTW
jgi:hypothetical protein